MQKKMTMLTIAIILVVSLMIYSVYNMFSEGADVPKTGTGLIGYTILVHYTDGSSQSFKQQSVKLEGLTITDMSNKPMESVDVILRILVTPSEPIIGWTVAGTQQMEAYKDSDITPKGSSTISIANSGTTLVAKKEIQLLSTNIPMSQLEEFVQKYGTGKWAMQYNSDLIFRVTFKSGVIVEFKNLQTWAYLNFIYTTETSSLSIAFMNEQLSL